MTQHQIIINMCRDGDWHCGNDFRRQFIFSPHKRRSEIEGKGDYYFEDRQCVHGNKLVRDYRMLPKKAVVLDRSMNISQLRLV